MEISRSLIPSLFACALLLQSPYALAGDLVDWVGKGVAQHRTVDPAPLDQMVNFLLPRIPTLELPDSAEAWTAEADSLRQRILEQVVFLGVPEEWRKGNHSVRWGEVIETGKGYRIRKLSYECLPGLHISALLYEPETIEGKVPVILNVNGHVGPPGKAIEYEQIRCINLAKRGMLALHPEWLSFGDLSGKEFDHNRSCYLDLCGVSGLSTFYLAMRGGLDVLLEHPSADPDRVAMTGLSGGGWQTIVLSALDERITITAPNAGYSGLHDRARNQSDIGDLEQNPADLLTVADYTHLTALLAPRPALLIYNHEDECCFKTERAKPSVYDPLIPFYELYGKADLFRFHDNLDPGTHNYELDNRQQFYRFVAEFFFPGREEDGVELHTADEILSVTELAVPLPEDNAHYVALANRFFEYIPTLSLSGLTGKSLAEAKEGARKRLAEILRLEPHESKLLPILLETEEGREHEVHRLEVGDRWKLPVHRFAKGGADRSVVLIADSGISSVTGKIAQYVNEGAEVWAVDLLFQGENRPGSTPNWQFSQMFSTVGARPLGIQAEQLAALAKVLAAQSGGKGIEVEVVGRNSEAIALCAGALAPEAVSVVHLPGEHASFKDLVNEVVSYSNYTTLFCFGLLEFVDVPELRELCTEVRIPSGAE